MNSSVQKVTQNPFQKLVSDFSLESGLNSLHVSA